VSTMTSMPEVEVPVASEEFVLSLTDVAAVKIQNILKERNAPEHGLRVFVAGGGCSGMQYGMALESQASDMDQVIEVNGIRLYVDPASAEYLHGATIDYEDNLMSGGFRISNPNAASTCKCGQSFRTSNSGSSRSSSGCGCH
jgi:iron-sulfur cluster assembly accessory protein